MSFIKSWRPIKPCFFAVLFRSSSTRRGTPHPGTRLTLPAPSQTQDAGFPNHPDTLRFTVFVFIVIVIARRPPWQSNRR